jgi:outer membrane protein TolC
VGAEADRRAAEADLARRLGLPIERVSGAALAQVRADSATLAGVDEPEPEHPLLRQARARARSAEAALREARSTRLPRLQSSGALLGYGGAGAFTGEWQAGLQLDYPIFLGGARRARVDKAAAETRRAEADARAAADAVDDATERARAGLVEAAARAAALATSVASFEELVRVEALALNEGAGVQSEYLRALAGVDAARTGLSDARRAVVLAAARLANAQGRLDRGWVESHVEVVR